MGRLGGWQRVDVCFRDGKRFEGVVRPGKIQGIVEVRRPPELRSYGAFERLNNLSISTRVKAAHLIAVDQINTPFLTGTH